MSELIRSTKTPTTEFVGPIVTTNDLDRWQHFLGAGFDLVPSARQTLDAAAVAALWGVKGHSAQTLLYTTPGHKGGIRVVSLSPGSDATIRDPASGYDCNALKVIDFFTPDIHAARQRLEAAGYQFKGDIAEYDLPVAKGIVEAHLWGPDDVVCALIGGPIEFFNAFVRRTDAVFSEIMSVSAPVQDPESVIDFYAAIGLRDVYRYAIDDVSFQHLVGAEHKMHIHAVNMGVAKEDPYLGIIHYGLPTGTFKTLDDRAVFPNRGMVAAMLYTDDIERIHTICVQHGTEIVCSPNSLTLSPHGAVRSLLVRAPHGVLHQFVEVLR